MGKKKVVSYYIDGLDISDALSNDIEFKKYKWLDHSRLVKCFLPPKTRSSNIIFSDIYYFTAFTHWDPDKKKKDKAYVNALESFGIKTVRGKFRQVNKLCTNCDSYYTAYEEKKTGIDIAVRLFQDALEDRFDTAVIISGNSGLLSAIKAVKTSFPSKEIGTVIPPNRTAEELKSNNDSIDFHLIMKEKHLAGSMFNDKILSNGEVMQRSTEQE
jgi:uncharacterized LabA/DUF88 family protein